MKIPHPQMIASPFGGNAKIVQTMPVSVIVEMYKLKAGLDISGSFHGALEVGLYQCEVTGYKFWRPEDIAGDENFYKKLSDVWPNYYRMERWEHAFARKYLKDKKDVLEIGCGPGHFLKSLEGGAVVNAMGIEFNTKAISEKVTKFPISPISIESLSATGEHQFDMIYAFQVLEHIIDPYSFIKSSIDCLKEDGLLMFSTPNHNHPVFKNQLDAFDLPPHHIGVFDPLIYQKIGKLFGLKILDVIIEGRGRSNLWNEKKSISIYMKLFVINVVTKVISIFKPKIGPNIIVVYKKNNDQ